MVYFGKGSRVTKPNVSGFYFLNATQFLGAFNDNILKQVVTFGLATGIWKGMLGAGGQAWASLCLAIPFVLFSGFAGQFSDKYSKRRISVIAKWSEIPIALIAMLGLWLTNIWIVMFSLILIAMQSTLFSPAKFGILPEIVPVKDLSRANGTINMFTYLAIILGCALGGPLYEHYAGASGGPRLLWLPGVVVLLVGVLGTVASHKICAVPAQNPNLKIKFNFFRDYFQTWRNLTGDRGSALKAALLGYTLFYIVIGGIAVLILPDYKDILDISYFRASVLLAILGVFTGIGDFVAGRVSKQRIRPELISFGAISTTAAFIALGLIPLSFYSNPAAFYVVAALLAAGGFTAGFVLVPLQTMVQFLSDEDVRGQILGLWICLSFVGVIIGNLIFLLVRNLDVVSAGWLPAMARERVFLVCAVLTIILQLLYVFRWRKQFSEAVGDLESSASEGSRETQV